MRPMLTSLILLAAALSVWSAESLQVAISVAPERPLIERMADAQHLNFDLLVDNQSAVAVDIDRVELSVFDASGSLPLQGRQINYDGHDVYGHHRRFDVEFAPIKQMGFKRNAMRYSYDFVPVDAGGNMFKGDFETNADWFGFGAAIRAIGDGVVVAVESSQPDDRQFDQRKLAADRMVLFGNYVVINHGGGEFGVYAHAQQGSILVKVGEQVAQGASIAKVGASGSALFTHLHFQLLSGPDMDAEALPSYFNGFSRVLGAKRLVRTDASIDSGEIVDSE